MLSSPSRSLQAADILDALLTLQFPASSAPVKAAVELLTSTQSRHSSWGNRVRLTALCCRAVLPRESAAWRPKRTDPLSSLELHPADLFKQRLAEVRLGSNMEEGQMVEDDDEDFGEDRNDADLISESGSARPSHQEL